MHYVLLFLASVGGLAARRTAFVQLLAIASFIVLPLFAIVTADASWDFEGYVELYRCAINAECGSKLAVESSFRWIAATIAALGGDSESGPILLIAFYVMAALSIKIALLYRYSAHFGAAIFSYAGYAFYLHEMTQIRVALAIAFVWLAVTAVASGRRAAGLGCVLVATVFHKSALVALLLLALHTKPWKPRFVFLAIAFAAVAGEVIHGLHESLDLVSFVSDPRLSAYLSAIGSPAFALNRINVSSLFLFLLTFAMAQVLARPMHGLSPRAHAMAVMATKSSALGLMIWLISWWIPSVGIRLMELMGSLYPLMFAALYLKYRHPLHRLILAGMITVIFTNLVIRNGLRLDFCDYAIHECEPSGEIFLTPSEL